MKKILALALCCGVTALAFAANNAEFRPVVAGKDLPVVMPQAGTDASILQPGMNDREAYAAYVNLKNQGAEIPAWLGQRFNPEMPAGADRQGGDFASNATPIPSLPYTDTGTTVGYGSEVGNPAPDVFYSITIPATTTITVSLCQTTPTWDTYLRIYQNVGGAVGTQVAANDDYCGLVSEINSYVIAAGNYFIVVEGYSSYSGAYTINVTSAGGNPCDAFNAALTPITLPYTGTGTNVGAPNVLGTSSGDVGYTFTLTEMSALTLTSCLPGTNYDSDSYVYLGNPCDGGTQVLYNDGNSACSYASWASEWFVDCGVFGPGTYTLVMSGYSSLSGNYEFSLSATSCACPPINCSGTAEVEPNDGPNGSPIVFGSIDCGETVCGTVSAAGGSRDTDWYELLLLNDAIVTVNMDVEAFDGVIIFLAGDANTIMYSANAGGFCTDETLTTGCLPAGTYYVFASCTVYDGLPSSNYGLTVSCQACTWVDPCDGAPPIACGGSYTGDTTGGINYVGNPAPDDIYVFTNTLPGANVTLSTCGGATWDTWLRVYNMCPMSPSAVQIASNDDACGLQSQLTFAAGLATYYVVVEGYSSSFGPYTLNVSCVVPVYDECQEPADPAGAWTAGTSEVDVQGTNYLRADRFGGLAGAITAVDFRGLPLVLSGSWTPCGEDPMPYTFTFYDLAMAPVASYNASLSGVASVSYAGYPSFDYHFDLPAPLTLSDGYLSIQGGGDNQCWFLWMSSATGTDGASLLSTDGAAWAVDAFDLNYCFTLGAATCDPVTDLSITVVTGDALLSWTATAGATSYKVYGATNGYGTYTLLGTTATPSFTDVNAQAAGRKFYKAVAVCE